MLGSTSSEAIVTVSRQGTRSVVVPARSTTGIPVLVGYKLKSVFVHLETTVRMGSDKGWGSLRSSRDQGT
jgi:hypothetical protein